MTIARKARIFWPVFLLLFLADCTTKDLAETHLAWSVPESVIGDFFRLTLGYNPGAALGISIGEHSRIFFSLTAAIIVIALTHIYRRAEPKSTIVGLSVGLLIGGALGNLYDRLRSPRGVVDFIDIGVGDVRFWTFNVADIGICIGGVLLAWHLSTMPESKPT